MSMPAGPGRDKTKFQWADGSTQPSLTPSGRPAPASGYSHWGEGQPNNYDKNNEKLSCEKMDKLCKYIYIHVGLCAFRVGNV